VGLFQRQHEGKRRKRSDSLDLAQEVGFVWVVLLRDRLQLPLVAPGMRSLSEPISLLQDGLEGRQKRLGDVLLGSLVEAPGRTFGQEASPEGLYRSLGTWLTSCVRQATNACLERIKAI
jgi:hypothetical protein